MKGMKKGGVITAAIAQRNRDVILRQESWRERQIERERGGGGEGARLQEREPWKPDSTPRDGTNDISTRFRFLQSRIIVRRVFGKFIERRMNNGCFFGLVVVLLLVLLLLFCFVHLLVQTEKGLGWENDSRREILL